MFNVSESYYMSHRAILKILDPPTEPQITPYFKSGLLNCVADGNPRPKLTWKYFPSREPSQIKTYANSPKFRIPDDNVNYNFR